VEHDDDADLLRALVSRGALDEATARACLDESRRRAASGGPSSVARVLAERGLVAPDVLERALVDVVQRGATVSARPPSSLGAAPPSSRGSSSRRTARPTSSVVGSSPGGTLALPPGSAIGGVARLGPARQAPERLGEYRIVKLLARGGMGAVYEAVHEPSGVHRAVKVLLRGGLSAVPEEYQRFRREAEVMARLDHPHVARVHAADLEADPCYIVQDLLPGGSLQDRLRKGPLPVDEAVAIAAKLCDAVAHAHERGVLHRDLKPANVLFDDRGEPRLTDFGLSQRAGSGSVALTATGQVLGTPAYMAPEQALGTKEIDARSDVYGLGALLYAMLVGREPFPGTGVAEVIERVCHDELTPPRRQRPEVPAAVDAAVVRAMAKDPAARFVCAGDLAQALRRPRGAAPAPVGPAPRLVLLVGALGVALVVVTTLAVGAFLGAPEGAGADAPSAEPRAAERAPAPPVAPGPTAPARWSGLAPGTRFDALLSLCAEGDGVGAPRLTASLLLGCEVGAPTADGRAALDAFVRRVRVQVRGPLFALDHDGATHKGDLPEVRRAFEAVVGQRLRLELDPTTGATRVDRLAPLRRAVLDAAPGGARDDTTRDWAIRAFADGLEVAALTRALDAMFQGRAPSRFAAGRLARGHVQEQLALGGRDVRAARSWHEVGTHLVVAKDTLGKIAEAHGLTFPALGMFNGIDDPNLIRVDAVLELPRAAPALDRRVVQVRRDQVIARDRPWGHEVATLPLGLRFVADAEDTGWVRFDFRGGWAWTPADAVTPVTGARAVELTSRLQFVRIERQGEQRFASRGQAYVVLSHGAHLTELQFDERPASVRAESTQALELSGEPR
jgi:nucleoid-associated protein YgaU